MVGCALAGFTANWAVDTPPVVPTFAQALEFIGDYEAARGGALRPHERTAALCHWLEVLAYAARIEHAREAVAMPAERRYRDELADHAREVLGDA